MLGYGLPRVVFLPIVFSVVERSTSLGFSSYYYYSFCIWTLFASRHHLRDGFQLQHDGLRRYICSLLHSEFF